jgi:flagellar secretion chaperone FliS
VGFRPQKLENEDRIPGWSHHSQRLIRNWTADRPASRIGQEPTDTGHAMIDEYVESKVTTATPYQLHLMVIDGAIRHARAAHVALEQKNLSEARARLAQARHFVAEILSGLDEKKMAVVIVRLRAIFVFVLRNLVEADLHHNPQLVADALSILEMHRDTWLALAERLKQESPALVSSSTAGGYSWSS